MKNKSFDVSLVAFLGFFILSAGLFTVFSTGNVKSVYQSITATVPAAESQLAQVAVGQSVDVTGWAWSSNTGWISFNDTNLGAGGGNYQVKVIKTSSTLGTFDGYAWSPNVGWISFKAGDVSVCPTGSDGSIALVSGCTAAIDLSTGAVTGWARILSMKTENSANGWLQLSGLNHETSGGGGVVYDRTNGDLTGMAWESTAIGWTNFMASAPGLTTTPTGTLGGTCNADPSGTVAPGTPVTFTAYPGGGTAPYSYKWNSGVFGLASTYNNTYSSDSLGPTLLIRDSSDTYVANCPAVTMTTATGDLKLYIGANSANPVSTKQSHVVRQGTKFALNWDNELNTSLFTSCTMAVTNGGGPYWQDGINAGLTASGMAGHPTNLYSANVQEGIFAVSSITGKAINLSTTGVPRGTYEFTLTCADDADTNGDPVSKVILRVISASSEEF